MAPKVAPSGAGTALVPLCIFIRNHLLWAHLKRRERFFHRLNLERVAPVVEVGVEAGVEVTMRLRAFRPR